MVETANALIFESMDPGVLGAVILVGIPVAAIALIAIASQYPMLKRSATADAPHGASAVERH